jgi:hypothetical protein
MQFASFNVSPEAVVVRRLPFIAIAGPFGLVTPVNEIWLAPSIVVPPGTGGSGEMGEMVKTAPLNPGSVVGIRKLIVVGSGGEFRDRLKA